MIRCPESPSLDTQLHLNTVLGMNNDAVPWALGLLRAAAQLTLREPVKVVSIYLVSGQRHPALNTNEHRHLFASVYMWGPFLTTFTPHKPFMFSFTTTFLNVTLVLSIRPLHNTFIYYSFAVPNVSVKSVVPAWIIFTNSVFSNVLIEAMNSQGDSSD